MRRRAPVSPTAVEVGVGERVGAGEGVGEGADRFGQRRARSGQQPGGERAGAGDRHLLAEHRAHRQLVGVGGGRDPASGGAGDQRGERGIGAEDVVDGGRVGVEVEHPAAAGDGRAEVAQLGQRAAGR